MIINKTMMNATESEYNNIFKFKMNQIFKNSIEVVQSNSNTPYEKEKGWKRIKTSFLQTKNTLKFNNINAKSNIDFNKDKPFVNFYSHVYNINNPDEEEQLNDKLSSLISISYRSNFPKIKVPDDKGEYLTTDCGWGCVIRSCQMMFARSLYKLFKKTYNTTTEALIYHSLLYFLEYPFKFNDMPDTFSSIISKYLSDMYRGKSTTEKANNDVIEDACIEIVSITPPFSIQIICEVGTLFNKIPGQYYSDTLIPQIFRAINNEFDAISNLAIFSFQTVIDKYKIIEECFTMTNPKENSEEISFELNSDKIDLALGLAIEYKNIKYYFEKPGLLFISVRLGIKTIANEYFDSIKKMFQCKQFLGFVGGKDAYAYYFFGYNDSNLYYLDPHINQETVTTLTNTTFSTYSPKKISQMKFSKLKPCLTIGFLFRNLQEYNDLITWIENYSKQAFSCLNIATDGIKNIVCPLNGEMNAEGNDF